MQFLRLYVKVQRLDQWIKFHKDDCLRQLPFEVRNAIENLVTEYRTQESECEGYGVQAELRLEQAGM